MALVDLFDAEWSIQNIFPNYVVIPTEASLVTQIVKNLPVMQKTRVGSLGQEDPLEKGMATHSNILAWRIPRTEELGMLLPMGSQSQTQPSDLHVHFTIPEPI